MIGQVKNLPAVHKNNQFLLKMSKNFVGKGTTHSQNIPQWEGTPHPHHTYPAPFAASRSPVQSSMSPFLIHSGVNTSSAFSPFRWESQLAYGVSIFRPKSAEKYYLDSGKRKSLKDYD